MCRSTLRCYRASDFRYLVPCGALFCLEPLLVKVIRLSLPKLAGDLWGFYFVGWLRVEIELLSCSDFVPSLFSFISVKTYHLFRFPRDS